MGSASSGRDDLFDSAVKQWHSGTLVCWNGDDRETCLRASFVYKDSVIVGR